MSSEAPAVVVERQQWLEPVESGLQKAVSSAYRSTGTPGRKIENFLHGVWLGHPLHPVLTDIPLGGFTAALVLDIAEASGSKGVARGADIALEVGLAGAAGSAVTGLTDWHVTDGDARRVGVVHGLLNLTAAGLYLASLLQRKRGNRPAGRALAFAGFAISGAAAWLGGHLVYSKQIGVNHAAGQQVPMDWTPVLDAAQLREGEMRRATVGTVKILLVLRNSQIYAMSEDCSHLGGPLAEGTLNGDVVQCPWHSSRFRVEDGSVVDGPATHPQPSFDTRIQNGKIEVRGRRSD
jgi:nitrite reductase/ring-hydroxylating ferredoxin subunit/uncharacterized membrane protein